MRRITILFTVAAMMAVLLSISAGPASALVIGGDNDGRMSHSKDNGLFIVSNDNDWWDDDDDDFDFFGNHGFDFDDDDGEVSLGLGDVKNESGDIETENSFEIEGDNNNACLGQSQFGNSGNFTNQQGALQFDSDADDLEFGGSEISFAPENETACEQDVEQAAAASSLGWW